LLAKHSLEAKKTVESIRNNLSLLQTCKSPYTPEGSENGGDSAKR